MKTKAFAYLRVSGQGQLGGTGLDRQAQAIQKYAAANGVEIAETFREEGVSGTNDLDGRPALGRLIARLEANGVRLVVVENASRLARDLMVAELILDRFRKTGVKIVEAEGGNDLTVGDDNPTAKLIRQVLGAVAEFDKAVLVAKLRWSRQAMRDAKGRCEGRKPFGTKPGEGEIMDRIVALYRKPPKGDRLTFVEIAARLNAENVPTRTGAKWSASTVRGIVNRSRKS